MEGKQTSVLVGDDLLEKIVNMYMQFIAMWRSRWKALNFRSAKLVDFVILLFILPMKVGVCECLYVPRNYTPSNILDLSTWKQRN